MQNAFQKYEQWRAEAANRETTPEEQLVWRILTSQEILKIIGISQDELYPLLRDMDGTTWFQKLSPLSRKAYRYVLGPIQAEELMSYKREKLRKQSKISKERDIGGALPNKWDSTIVIDELTNIMNEIIRHH